MENLRHAAVCGAQQQRALEASVRQTMQAWSQHWFSMDVECSFRLNQQLFGALKLSGKVTGAGDLCLVTGNQTNTLRQLLHFASGFSGEISQSELDRTGQALLQALHSDLASRIHAGTGQTSQFQMEVQLDWPEFRLIFALSAQWVQKQLQTQTAARHKFTLTEAVLPLATSVQLTMPAMPMSLQQLKQLKVGDVLPLQRRLSEPLLLASQGNQLMKGFLVEHQQYKAVFLTAKTEKNEYVENQ